MLTLKDLDNRVYSGKICSEFSYILKDDKGKPKFRANFARGKEENEWQMRIVLDRTRDADSQVYTFRYIMPKSNLPLELIAATGLKYFQLYLKEEIQNYVKTHTAAYRYPRVVEFRSELPKTANGTVIRSKL